MYEEKDTTRPGDAISVDQIRSPTSGLISQMNGLITTKRYRYANVYVEHVLRLSYIYPQNTASTEETL